MSDPVPEIAPFCPHYGSCGGCSAQHLAPEPYRVWKEGRLREALSRAGLATAPAPLVDAHGAGRRRVTFHARRLEEGIKVGFMAARSHTLVPIDRCPIAVPDLAQAAPCAEALAREIGGAKPLDIAVTASLAGLDIDLRGSGPLGDRRRQGLVDLAGRLDLARLSLHGDVLVERRPPATRMGPTTIVPPPGGFLQATEAGEEALGSAVLDAVGEGKRVVDLFSGIGPFSLRLATRMEVHAVEASAEMLAALDKAFRRTTGLCRITTETRDLFRRPLLPPELESYDAIVLDPPRAGAEAQARQIAASAARRVVMVSCDAGTFARDASTLTGAGFSLERVLPVDQFKWSRHLEIVGLFGRAAKTRKPGTARLKPR